MSAVLENQTRIIGLLNSLLEVVATKDDIAGLATKAELAALRSNVPRLVDEDIREQMRRKGMR